ncbi:MAG TPA: helix-turn-helix domain-containing protein [Bacteroidales bacterium]|nr:helix-turn-helix domain-containing protein [Bacteroidales bacterium]
MLKDLLVFFEFHSKWVFVILVYQTFLLSIFFFFFGRWSKSRSNLILSLFFLISGIIFLAFLFQHTGQIRLSGVLNILLPGGFLLLMPAGYLYLRIKTDNTFGKRMNELLHYAPAAILILVNMILATLNQSARQNFMQEGARPAMYTYLVQIALLVQLLYYSFRYLKLLRKESPSAFKTPVIPDLAKNKWLVLLFASFGLFYVIMSVMVIDSMLYNKQTDDIIPYILLFIVITMLIALFSMKQKDARNLTFEAQEANSQNIPQSDPVYSGKQDNTSAHDNRINNKPRPQLDCQKKEELTEAVSKLIEEKAFIDPKFSLDWLSKKVPSNSKYISQVVNEMSGKPFIDYVNELRIKEAKKLLTEKNAGKYSIEGIGQMVGYQSKSTFNTHFKKLIGMTPSEYLKKQQQ